MLLKFEWTWPFVRIGDRNVIGHRKIYIGEVPEIEGETGLINLEEKEKLKSPQLPQDDELTDTEFELSKIKPGLQSKPSGGRPSMTMRRNSIGLGSTSSREPPKLGRNTGFPSNMIVSSRYTWYNFLPKNLSQQLRRVVNTYFVCLSAIQLLSDSPVSPLTTLAPLIFVMLVTALKQGYEDWLRHSADNLVNNRLVNIVKDGEIKTVRSKEVVVGDIVKLEAEEQVPADIIIVGSSDEFSRCQISTANLDGETNLKIRYSLAGLPNLKTEEQFIDLDAIVEVDQPSADLYSLTGSMLIPYDQTLHTLSTSFTALHRRESATIPNNQTLKNPTITETKRSSVISIKSDHSSSIRKAKNSRKSSHNSLKSTPSPPVSNFVQLPISMDNVALRGTRVKNTDFIYGIVVYTGEETRLAINSQRTSTKFSTTERSVNRFLVLFIIFLLLLVMACTLMHYYFFYLVEFLIAENAWYLDTEAKVGFQHVFNTFTTFIILFNYIIPISLYVTMELQKFFGSKFFVYDLEMRCPITGQPPLCNTSDLNEELGQIEYLFSDKTGTLTQNIMQFRYCSVGLNRYDFKDDSQLFLVDDEQGVNELVNHKESKDLTNFLRTLALCHTVQLMPHRRPSFEVPGGHFTFNKRKKVTAKMKAASSLFTLETDGDHLIPGIMANFEFQASSPDEKALLEACCKMGMVYSGEKENILTVDVFGKRETFKRHFILEFDADRKCMSVIVENSQGEIWLLSKGAETSIIGKSVDGPIEETLQHVANFAMMGMRTLVVAERKLTKAELEDFSQKIKQARRMVKNREDRMREIYASMERNLTVIGSTGVEDQLQEGVPETLQALSAAGIRVWMITGDKVETGVTVAISCGLVTPATTQLYCIRIKTAEEIIKRLTELSLETVPGENTTLIIDGESLKLGFEHCPDLFREVAMHAYRVVCCRMSPIQKAQVVIMVKQSSNNPITAAVGDGANDVAMIQEAHIGIGIFGKEGRQAARCSDFALARFSFLKKAILVHGHWFYVRIAVLAIYFFYKNFLFILPQVYYAYDSGFSGETLYNAFFLTMFNLFFTASPIFTFGLQEQPYPAKTLLNNPHLYKKLTRNSYLTWKCFVIWHLLAVWHSIICYYIPKFTWLSQKVELTDSASLGAIVYLNILFVAHVKMFEFIHFVSGWTVFSFFYSTSTLLIWTGIYSEVDLRIVGIDPQGSFKSFFKILSDLYFWCALFLVIVIALTPDFVGRTMMNSYPTIRKIRKRIRKKLQQRKVGSLEIRV